MFLDGVACGLVLVPALIFGLGIVRFRGVFWYWRLAWNWSNDTARPWVAFQVSRDPIRVAPILATREDMAALAAYREAALASPQASDTAGAASRAAGGDARGGA